MQFRTRQREHEVVTACRVLDLMSAIRGSLPILAPGKELKFNPSRKVLVAAAWPYANGPLHLGHLAALLPADVLARYHRSLGDDVLFVSGSDCYGTPVSVTARREGVSPAQVADRFDKQFRTILIEHLGFTYDLFGRTTEHWHERCVHQVFRRLQAERLIEVRKTVQLYCPGCRRFLADRYLAGTCPSCGGAAGGDQCGSCGVVLSATDLVKPICALCDQSPYPRSTSHHFLRLSKFTKRLRTWAAESQGWRNNALAQTRGFLRQDLRDRPITRDLDWGVPLPFRSEGKVVYVWFEAVCGYLSASRQWAVDSGEPDAWKSFWHNPSARHYYVHGKDNILFHSTIWPAILLGLGSEYHLPDRLVSSEYLRLKGKQFSTSKAHGVTAEAILRRYQADSIRFYLLYRGPEKSDVDFEWSDFESVINGDLIGKIGNFCNRTLALGHRHFPGGIPSPKRISATQLRLLNLANHSFADVGKAIECGEFRESLRSVLALARAGNKYFNDVQPWLTVKNNVERAKSDLSVALHLVKCIASLLSPICPTASRQLAEQLAGSQPSHWRFPDLRHVQVTEVAPVFDPVKVDGR